MKRSRPVDFEDSERTRRCFDEGRNILVLQCSKPARGIEGAGRTTRIHEQQRAGAGRPISHRSALIKRHPRLQARK
jgi:hypothetical protein